MKSLVILFLIILSGIIITDARAQDANALMNVESVSSIKPQRTPMMVVHETAIPVQAPAKPVADALKPQGKPAKGTASKSVNTASKTSIEKLAASEATASAAPASPIVLPGAQTVSESGPLEFESTGNAQYDEFIKQSAARNGIDPNLIVAVMHHESGFNLRARSYKGAMGLMQLMPATARRFGVTNVYDPAQNIEGGARYLRFLLDTFNGDVRLALAGYNAGENAVVNYGFTVPPYRETKNYVHAISARYDRKRGGRAAKTIAAVAPTAPAPATFSGGASSRLSNNY